MAYNTWKTVRAPKGSIAADPATQPA